MRSEDVVLLSVGIVGILLGVLSLAAKPDLFGTVMGLLVLAMGSLSLWLGWLFVRGRDSGHPPHA